MPSSLDGGRQFALMPEAIPGDAARDDAPSLREKIAHKTALLKIHGAFFNAKATGPATLKKPSSAATPPTVAPSTATAAAFTFHNRLPCQLLRFFILVTGIIVSRRFATTALAASVISSFR